MLLYKQKRGPEEVSLLEKVVRKNLELFLDVLKIIFCITLEDFFTHLFLK